MIAVSGGPGAALSEDSPEGVAAALRRGLELRLPRHWSPALSLQIARGVANGLAPVAA